ncbi:MAG: L,D-transpeptidase, partial [Flexilinea sp.]|nr:L,D-transpeptidase [Flexilinea sp.]
EGVTNGRWIEVDLHEQVVMAYENNSLVFAAMVATGMKPFYTKPGIFQIYEKKEAENMTGAFEADKSDYYSLDDVPFTMYFDEARALHGAYWRAWYGYEQSHGCVNMTIGDAHWLYNWAQIGDTVYVHDPSGETPTDPSYYGAGGA